MGFFQRLKEGLKKTSDSFTNVFKANEIDDDFYDELEETLISENYHDILKNLLSHHK